MDKLQYDSLYKFLVSLGIILIALPIAALVYLLNSEPILIVKLILMHYPSIHSR